LAAFFAKFDASGRVAATRFVSLYNRKSIDEQLENRAFRKSSASLKSAPATSILMPACRGLSNITVIRLSEWLFVERN
jgi:hypothetical protein